MLHNKVPLPYFFFFGSPPPGPCPSAIPTPPRYYLDCINLFGIMIKSTKSLSLFLSLSLSAFWPLAGNHKGADKLWECEWSRQTAELAGKRKLVLRRYKKRHWLRYQHSSGRRPMINLSIGRSGWSISTLWAFLTFFASLRRPSYAINEFAGAETISSCCSSSRWAGPLRRCWL